MTKTALILIMLFAALPMGHANEGGAMPELIITAGNQTFRAKLYDNPSVKAFVALLPLSITMGEFNGNEKEYRLPRSLPSESRSVGSIKTGDFMLYGGGTLVLFYKSFPTPYTYTKLGYIEDPRGLEAALGRGSVQVKWELAK